MSEAGSIDLKGIVFAPGASAYTISCTNFMNFSGTGVTNNSGVPQNINSDVGRDHALIEFTNKATSGNSVNYNAAGGPRSDFIGGQIYFYDQSTTGSGGVFTTNGGVRSGASGSEIIFADESTAAGVTFICNPRRERLGARSASAARA